MATTQLVTANVKAENIKDWAISRRATRQRAEASETSETNPTLDEITTSTGRGAIREDIVRPVMKVTEAAIKNAAITQGSSDHFSPSRVARCSTYRQYGIVRRGNWAGPLLIFGDTICISWN